LVVWNYEFKQVLCGPGSVIIQFQTQSFIKFSSLFVHLKIKYSKYKVNIMKYKVVKIINVRLKNNFSNTKRIKSAGSEIPTDVWALIDW
jgi:hypothetical protein